MKYVTSVERLAIERGLQKGMAEGLEKGMEKGLEKGREEGRAQGSASILLRQLNRRFGPGMTMAIVATTAVFWRFGLPHLTSNWTVLHLPFRWWFEWSLGFWIAELLARDRVGRDVFLRAKPEGLRDVRVRRWDASLYDLLSAYGQVKLRTEPVVHMVSRRPVVTLDAALHHLERLIGVQLDWAELSDFLPSDYQGPLRRSAIASSFLAALELARQGRVDLKQDAAFEPLYLKAAKA